MGSQVIFIKTVDLSVIALETDLLIQTLGITAKQQFQNAESYMAELA